VVRVDRVSIDFSYVEVNIFEERSWKGMVVTSDRRAYRAPQRDATRNQTRERIRLAARQLFLTHGYAATTLAQIGEQAGVSRRYVQMSFGSKADLLSAVIKVAVAGDDAPVPLAGRDAWTEMLETGGHGTLAAYAAMSTEICERTAGLLAVATAAAEVDDQLAGLRAHGLLRRHQDCAAVVNALAADGLLIPGYTLPEATDILYVLSSPETYLLLTQERGWLLPRYESWLAQVLGVSLLDTRGSPGLADV